MGLTKQEKQAAKSVASDAALEGRTEDALRILTQFMSREQAARELPPTPTPKVGDILESSWGYDQTNINYYQVVSVTKASVRIREIASRRVGGGTGYDHVVPAPGAFVGNRSAEHTITRCESELEGLNRASDAERIAYLRAAIDKARTQIAAETKGNLHRIQKGDRDPARYSVSLDYRSATLWDGQPAHETAAGYGH